MLFRSSTFRWSHCAGNAVSRLKENVAPYTRYVHAEQDRIENTEIAIAQIRQSLSALRARIDAVEKG